MAKRIGVTKNWATKLASIAQKREANAFSQWSGLPNPETEEELSAWYRLKNLYDFLLWIKEHNAWLREVSTYHIIAVDGPNERRFDPDGGLTPELWPYFQAALVPADDDLMHINRCEIVEAILQNEIQRRGHSILACCSAVEEFVNEVNKTGIALWIAVNELTFAGAIEYLDHRAKEIDEKLHEKKSGITSSTGELAILSVTHAARIAHIDPGNMTRWRTRYGLAAKDGVSIDAIKLLELLKKYKPKRQSVKKNAPMAAKNVEDSDDEPISIHEAVFYFLRRRMTATHGEIASHLRETFPDISNHDILQELSNSASYHFAKEHGQAVYRLVDSDD